MLRLSLKEAQALEMLEKAKSQLFPALFDQMEKNLPSHADGIIQKCQETLSSHMNRERDNDLVPFKKICERYNDSNSDAKKLSYERSLKEIITRHENDLKFMQAIESSNDKNILKVTELFKNDPLTQDKTEVSRGFER